MSPSPAKDDYCVNSDNDDNDVTGDVVNGMPENAVNQLTVDTDGSSDESDAVGSQSFDGYQLLPSEYHSVIQSVYNIAPASTDDSQGEGEANNDSLMQLGTLSTNNEPLLEQMKLLHETKPLDSERVNQILDIMKNIHLPTANIPSWTNIVNEEEWKAELLSLARAKPAATRVEQSEHQ